MAVDLKFTVHIERPLDVVCAAVSDLCNMPKWFSVSEIRNITPGPLEVGTQFQIVTEFMGKPQVMHYQVTEYEPCRKFTYTTMGTSKTQITLQLSPFEDDAPDVTTLTLRFTSHPPRILEHLLKSHISKQTSEDLGRFATLLEDGQV